MKEKTTGEIKREELFSSPKNGFDMLSEAESTLCMQYCEKYKDFLNHAKTERDAVKRAVTEAETYGFIPYARGMELIPGTKIYKINRDRGLTLAVIGRRPVSEGTNIAAAHVDAPRLDLKPNPIYEDSEMAFFKTHYYGGIKKYQWVTIPLELRGVVVKKDGKKVDVNINDPLFVITDLLPHLSADQYKKTLGAGISGEGLNILIGSRPFKDDTGSDRVKLEIMSLLNEKYGITEEDFMSAELSAVPAFDACDIGLDRSFIGGYGHDDRVCSYGELLAIMETEMPEKTAICILADKEEIGSEGVSGMKSREFDAFMEDICAAQGVYLRDCYANSCCISADVCNAFDPNFPEVSEKRNNAKVNYGVGICKYTGHGGKSGASDASAELVAKIRRIFDCNEVKWQMAELGKVDQGGGGTVAKFMAERNIDTIDAGVPVLSMHAPFELVAKFDTYMLYKGIKAFYSDK